tara:strand:- start:95 stop:379 length:285 start_codon:yes stop_codon:yes gene_type:complete
MDMQLVLNVAFGIIAFLAGWLFKFLFSSITKIQENCKNNSIKALEDYRSLDNKINNIALTMSEKYVSKDDHNQLVKVVHHRFDKLEEKIDSHFN